MCPIHYAVKEGTMWGDDNFDFDVSSIINVYNGPYAEQLPNASKQKLLHGNVLQNPSQAKAITLSRMHNPLLVLTLFASLD